MSVNDRRRDTMNSYKVGKKNQNDKKNHNDKSEIGKSVGKVVANGAAKDKVGNKRNEENRPGNSEKNLERKFNKNNNRSNESKYKTDSIVKTEYKFKPDIKTKLDDKVKSENKGKTGFKPKFDTKDRKGIRVTRGANDSRDKKDNRRMDACPHLRDCGGCNILKKSYDLELKEKQKMVEDLLKGYCKVEPIIGMKEPKHYRNKVHVVFDHDRKGNPISGVYEEKSHRVVAIEQCLIHNEKADEIIATIRGLLKSFKIKTYDEDTGYGLLRHVLIRTGYSSGEIMVVLVLSSPILPSKNNFVKALRDRHPEISTIVINVNDKKTSMVLGEKEQVIYGKGFIEDKLCEKVFRISPKSFYQVNPAQTEVLYKKAIEMAGLSGNETVVDAYCGTGTIGIIASDHVKKVIGVELNKDAVKDAVINAKRNEATNIEFYQNDAGEFMTQMAEQNVSVDLVFMDPPRTGSSEKFLDAIAMLKPKKVVYISCNPITLERDLKYITKKGYKAQRAVPVDMFPWTEHVETCCLLYKR